MYQQNLGGLDVEYFYAKHTEKRSLNDLINWGGL